MPPRRGRIRTAFIYPSVALLLSPLVYTSAVTTWRILIRSTSADTAWAPTLAGAGCWITAFILLPKPLWTYVLGHEFTHALCTWLSGGTVKQMKVRSSGGHVVVSKSNIVITLAPYFFPLYLILVLVAFSVSHQIWNLTSHFIWLHFLSGAAYAYHLTFTGYVLQRRQADLEEYGYLLSWIVILLGNFSVLIFLIPIIIQQPPLIEAMEIGKTELLNTVGFLLQSWVKLMP